MIWKILVPILTLLFSDLVSGGTLPDRRQSLDRVAITDRFRIFYTLSGKDALPSERQTDADNSGTPDYIEQLAQRFVKVDKFYRTKVGLISPLDSDRYKGRAHYIDINLLNLSDDKGKTRNGIAYDGTPKLDRVVAGAESLNVLLIDLSNSLSWENKTVEHELFHLFQNGYTYFKNPWYTEGTARWSELIMNGRLGSGGGLPHSEDQKQELFHKTYDANTFWNELILRSDKAALGKNFIKKLLEKLGEIDGVAARDRGIESAPWPESEQRSEDNDPYIWRAVLETMREIGYTESNDKDVSKLHKL